MTTQSARLDYYRATTTDKGAIIDATRDYFSEDNTEPSIPLYGYRGSLKHIHSGALYLFGGHTPTMGNCIQLGGQALTALMDAEGKPSVPALARVHDYRWNVTRLDIAIDVFHPELRPRHVYAALDRKAAKTIWRSWREVAQKNLDAGHTVYGGGLESEKRIRIYDKAAESGAEGVWTRYEMVFSGQRARDAWSMVENCRTDGELLVIARSMLTSMLDFPNWREWHDEFGEGAEVVWTEVPRVESDEWRWLVAQVMPTFRDAYDKDGDWRLLERFMREVRGNQ